MDNTIYLIASIKLGMWFGNGTYVSDIAQAKRFPDRDSAIKFCKKHVALDGGIAAVPVLEADALELTSP